MKPKAFLCRSPIGLFAFSGTGELLHYSLFSRKPQTAVAEFETASLELQDFDVSESPNNFRFLRKNFREYAENLGFAKSQELTEFLSNFTEIISKKRMKSLINRDRLIIQASNSLEDIVKIQNLVNERLREWYLLHYPELKQKEMPEWIMKYGNRANSPNFKESVGIDLTESDERILLDSARLVLSITEQRKKLENYIGHAMKEIAPNFSSLIDPLLAAKFLSLAGSMERLAKMPSSTIQLLGAEKALFRHLRNQGKSPKFGIIFLDPRVQNAAAEKKGKVARVLSSKLMLAGRIDFYSKRDDSEKLKAEMKEEFGKI